MNYYIHYRIGTIKFASPIDEVKEITRTKKLTTAESLPKNIVGFFELRGKRICLFNLPSFLGIETGAEFEVILTETNDTSVGFRVEKVYGIVYAEKTIPYPHIVPKKDFLTGVIKHESEILQVLSFTRILSGTRLKAIQKIL